MIGPTAARLLPAAFLLAALTAALAGCAPGGAGAPERSGEVRVLFVGDTCFGESYRRERRLTGRGDILAGREYDYPLSRLRPLLAGAHLVVANLEGPLTRMETSPFAGRKEYIHRSDPERAAAALARHNIRAACLANNHAMDYGLEGLGDTLAALAKHGIRGYGAGPSETEAERPLLETVKVGGAEFRLAVIGAFEVRDNYAERGFYAREKRGGVAALDVEAVAARIRRLKEADPELFVAVTPHWGANYGYRRERDAENARRLVDAGADLVVAHGAHHFQAIEQHRGRWILHNIGNFVFNAPGRYRDRKSPAMSLAVCLALRPAAGGVAAELRCYPIMSDNLVTGYRSRPVSPEDFGWARELLSRRSPDPADFERRVASELDRVGPCLRMKVR